MDEAMTMQEIEARFDSEWVLLEDPDVSQELGITGGKVLWHSKDRDEVYRKAMAIRPKRLAILYAGTIPEGVAFAL